MEAEFTNQKLEITENTIGYIREARKWTMFLSIVGFIFMGFVILLIPILFAFQSNYDNNPLTYATIIPLILIVVIYFFPIYYLYMFSKFSKKAINNSDSGSLEIAFKYLKSHYRFMGILMIVLLCFYLIAGLIAAITLALK